MSNIIQTFPKGSGGGHVVLDTNGTAVDQEKKLQFTGFDVSDDSTNEKTEVKAVGLNTDSLDDILSAGEVNTNIVQTGLCYSTSEQVVGKWIDGKPLYQRTVDLGSLSANSWNDHYINTIENVDMVLKVSVVGVQTSGRYVSEFYRNSSDMYTQWILKMPSEQYIMELGLTTTALSHRYATLQYTKTTD